MRTRMSKARSPLLIIPSGRASPGTRSTPSSTTWIRPSNKHTHLFRWGDGDDGAGKLLRGKGQHAVLLDKPGCKQTAQFCQRLVVIRQDELFQHFHNGDVQ